MAAKKNMNPLWVIGLLQATGIASYVFFVDNLMSNFQKWFGPTLNDVGQGTVFLLLFIMSAMITSLLAFGYPFIMFWVKKKPKKALLLVVFTALWLVAFFFFFLFLVTR